MLAGTKSLSPEDMSELTDAYLLLRKAENAVQMIRDEQQHSIPSEPLDRARLCVNLGEPDWPAAIARIDARAVRSPVNSSRCCSGAPRLSARPARKPSHGSIPRKSTSLRSSPRRISRRRDTRRRKAPGDCIATRHPIAGWTRRDAADCG